MMGRSQLLRLRDIRSAFRLVGEARDMGADPSAWRSHVIGEMARLVGGSVAMTLDLHEFLPGRVPRWVAPADLGWESDLERRRFLDYLGSDLPKEDPSAVAWLALLTRRSIATATRREMIADRDWYGSPIVSEGRRSSRIDDPLISCALIGGPGRVHGFQVYRPWGARGFERRERNLVRLIHLELLRHLDRGPMDDGLAPHLRRVLRPLLGGLTTKEIARTLSLSAHTVDGYIKAIYAHYQVGSRARLIALAPDRPPPGRLSLPQGF